jgi:hypothetical protein
LAVIEPESVVMQALEIFMPQALFVPFAAVPVIVTLPVPAAEMMADEFRKTP